MNAGSKCPWFLAMCTSSLIAAICPWGINCTAWMPRRDILSVGTVIFAKNTRSARDFCTCAMPRNRLHLAHHCFTSQLSIDKNQYFNWRLNKWNPSWEWRFGILHSQFRLMSIEKTRVTHGHVSTILGGENFSFKHKMNTWENPCKCPLFASSVQLRKL